MATHTCTESIQITLVTTGVDTVTFGQRWSAVIIQNGSPTERLFYNVNKSTDPTIDLDGTGDDGTRMIPSGGNARVAVDPATAPVIKLVGNANVISLEGTN